jgi:hypothetical protein
MKLSEVTCASRLNGQCNRDKRCHRAVRFRGRHMGPNSTSLSQQQTTLIQKAKLLLDRKSRKFATMPKSGDEPLRPMAPSCPCFPTILRIAVPWWKFPPLQCMRAIVARSFLARRRRRTVATDRLDELKALFGNAQFDLGFDLGFGHYQVFEFHSLNIHHSQPSSRTTSSARPYRNIINSTRVQISYRAAKKASR